MQKPCFISLEGVDGAGKSTHFAWLQQILTTAGVDFISTREPGGTDLGEQLRDLLLHQPMQLKTETLLMFAARNEHWHQKIAPALQNNQWILCDRFMDSSYAYQGGGRQLGADVLGVLDAWLDLKQQPDHTFLFDLPWDIAKNRINSNRNNQDRFEQEDNGFFERTRSAYLDRYQQDKQRFQLIDASNSIEQIQQQMLLGVNRLIAVYTDLPAITSEPAND